MCVRASYMKMTRGTNLMQLTHSAQDYTPAPQDLSPTHSAEHHMQ